MPSVLVVDDDQDIRESLAEVLGDEGFSVSAASNGVEALEEIARSVPDVMLLDLMMPVMNGWQVLEKLRSSHRKLPIVILSALEAHGCVDYVQKPISLPRLLTLLDTLRTKAAASISMRVARQSD